jgi:hypothetical protein
LRTIGNQLKAFYEHEQTLPVSDRLAMLIKDLESRLDRDEPERGSTDSERRGA